MESTVIAPLDFKKHKPEQPKNSIRKSTLNQNVNDDVEYSASDDD